MTAVRASCQAGATTADASSSGRHLPFSASPARQPTVRQHAHPAWIMHSASALRSRHDCIWHTVSVCRATKGSMPSEELEDEEVLTKEEDWVVPGGYKDSLSKNTPLGRALSDACDELGQLGAMEAETVQKANDLLAKLGYKVVEEDPQGGS